MCRGFAYSQLLKQVLQERFEELQSIVDWAIPDIVFAPSKALTQNRFHGVIKAFEEEGDKRSATIECPAIKVTWSGNVGLCGQYRVLLRLAFILFDIVSVSGECERWEARASWRRTTLRSRIDRHGPEKPADPSMNKKKRPRVSS